MLPRLQTLPELGHITESMLHAAALARSIYAPRHYLDYFAQCADPLLRILPAVTPPQVDFLPCFGVRSMFLDLNFQLPFCCPREL